MGEIIREQGTVRYETTHRDCMCDILRRFDLSYMELTSMNPGVDMLALAPGQVLNVRDKELAADGDAFVYTLCSGESLSSVCIRFNMTEGEALRMNRHLLPSEFTPGQRIRVRR